MIVTSVKTSAEHEERLRHPDGYRPARCHNPSCGSMRMHMHSFCERALRAFVLGLEEYPLRIRRYRCAACRAIWRVLPGFVSRWLWRAWSTVGRVVEDDERPPVVPARTRRRWKERLGSVGRILRSVLLSSGEPGVVGRLLASELDATRRELIAALGGGRKLAQLAAFVHEQAPDVRVL